MFLQIGAKNVYIEDLREDFLKNYILPAIQCNALYENLYLMGTSLARPCISKRAVSSLPPGSVGCIGHNALGRDEQFGSLRIIIVADERYLSALRSAAVARQP